MSIFKNKNLKHYVLELYKITDQQTAPEFDTRELIINSVELLQKTTELKADVFTLNYDSKSYKIIKSFASHFTEVIHCHIDFDSNNTNTYFSVSNPMLNYLSNAKRPSNSNIEISFQISEEFINETEMNNLADDLVQTFDFEYGYIHKFPTGKYHGEKRTNRGLFSTTISVDKFDHLWTNHKIGILNGYIKKLYQVNYLNKSQTENLLIAHSIKSHGEVKEISNDIIRWTISDEEFQIEQEKLQDVCIVTDDLRFENNPISSQLKSKMIVDK